MKLRTMPWDERVWLALRRAITAVPLRIRMEALISVVEGSEEEARRRGSLQVEEADLVKAAKKKVPRAFRSMALQILKECGVNVNGY